MASVDKNYTGATERDYADKAWLGREEDSFQIVSSEVAGAIFASGLVIGFVLDALQSRGLI